MDCSGEGAPYPPRDTALGITHGDQNYEIARTGCASQHLARPPAIHQTIDGTAHSIKAGMDRLAASAAVASQDKRNEAKQPPGRPSGHRIASPPSVHPKFPSRQWVSLKSVASGPCRGGVYQASLPHPQLAPRCRQSPRAERLSFFTRIFKVAMRSYKLLTKLFIIYVDLNGNTIRIDTFAAAVQA